MKLWFHIQEFHSLKSLFSYQKVGSLGLSLVRFTVTSSGSKLDLKLANVGSQWISDPHDTYVVSTPVLTLHKENISGDTETHRHAYHYEVSN